MATRPERRPGAKTEGGRHDAALSFPFGIGTKAANRSHLFRCALHLISQPRFLHFTLNHYKERYGLTNQLRRAAVSVPSNIAEGQGRCTTRDFLRCLSIALGSLQELETQLIIARRLNDLEEVFRPGLFESTNEVARLLNGLRNSLARKSSQGDV